MLKIPLIVFVLLSSFIVSQADEGMWIPLLLKKFNEADMQRKGMRIGADDIYSVNHASLKDAVVLFGGGCTAEVISNKGLLLTNHHCGFYQIQSHSTLEKNYIKNGFWAKNFEEELPCAGLTVTFLIRMEDVTLRVLGNLPNNLKERDREEFIRKSILKIKKEVSDTNKQIKVSIEPFFEGNQYFMFISRVYKDIRLVAAPPNAIGNFGGDTDNWMWPRHTGDFSLFRIYADSSNQPIEYATTNKPYHPIKHLKLSIKGVKQGDFTMVMGYPGSTEEYLPSTAVSFVEKELDPTLINICAKRLTIIESSMAKDESIALNYASKQKQLANYYKKWIGEKRGLERFDVISKKEEFEKHFLNWVGVDSLRRTNYGMLLTDFKNVYPLYSANRLWEQNFAEAILGSEYLKYVSLWVLAFRKDLNPEQFLQAKTSLRNAGNNYFAKCNEAINAKLLAEMLAIFAKNIPDINWPLELIKLNNKYKGNWEKAGEEILKKSLLADHKKMPKLLERSDKKLLNELNKDLSYLLMKGFYNYYAQNVYQPLLLMQEKIDSIKRVYMKGILEMDSTHLPYPDANHTLRITYGKVDGYKAADAVEYNYFTTLDGMMEKENSAIEDYHVDARLKKLYNAKDYGRYGQDGKMPICFIASNHTTGGNSGSPVLDANGDLIGVNFDRVWEGTMSDLYYDTSVCRNVSLDIRYFLFIVDKYAGATNLLSELELVE